MTLVTQAVIFAAQAHDGAARKGSEIPYIVHPMEVVAIASTKRSASASACAWRGWSARRASASAAIPA